MAHGMANFISDKAHKPYTYSDNHYKLSHELGKIFVVGNGSLNVPFVDNFLSIKNHKEIYSESQTPDYSRTADYHRKFKQIFKAVRVMDRDQLEAKYQELNQQVYFKLSAGGGAAVSNEQREALLTRAANEDLKISDYVDTQKINKFIYGAVYRLANDFPTKQKKSNATMAERVDRAAVGTIFRESIFPDLERLRDLFPQSSVYQVPVAVVDPFAEEAQKTSSNTVTTGLRNSSSRPLQSQIGQIIPTDRY